MSGFTEVLSRFHNAILHNEVSAALADIKPHPRMTPVQQMAIYSEGYRIRLVQAIRSDYPALLELLGGNTFGALALAYVETHPSTGYNLDRYPHGFAAFVQQKQSWFAGELAILEGAIAEVFMLPESEPLSPDALAGMSPEAFGALRLPLRTASRLLQFSTPVNDWFIAQRAGKMPAAPAPQGTCLYVWRHQHEVRRAPLDEAACLLLARLGQGDTVSEALDYVAMRGHGDAVTVNLQSWFAQWVADGFLAATQELR